MSRFFSGNNKIAAAPCAYNASPIHKEAFSPILNSSLKKSCNSLLIVASSSSPNPVFVTTILMLSVCKSVGLKIVLTTTSLAVSISGANILRFLDSLAHDLAC